MNSFTPWRIARANTSSSVSEDTMKDRCGLPLFLMNKTKDVIAVEIRHMNIGDYKIYCISFRNWNAIRPSETLITSAFCFPSPIVWKRSTKCWSERISSKSTRPRFWARTPGVSMADKPRRRSIKYDRLSTGACYKNENSGSTAC